VENAFTHTFGEEADYKKIAKNYLQVPRVGKTSDPRRLPFNKIKSRRYQTRGVPFILNLPCTVRERDGTHTHTHAHTHTHTHTHTA
jgi:hypothetical protein